MDRLNQVEIYKTMLESSQANTQAWVNKYNELEKKYDQALTVIASKKIMEMQEENERYEKALIEIAKIVKLDAFAFNELSAKVYETALNALDKEEV